MICFLPSKHQYFSRTIFSHLATHTDQKSVPICSITITEKETENILKSNFELVPE